MLFKIIYDSYSRLRVKLPYFTKKQKYAIESTLLALPCIDTVKANVSSSSVLITYNSDKDYILDTIKNLDLNALDEIPMPDIAKADEEFKKNLEKVVIRKILNTIFLPLPLRTALTYYRATKYALKGVDSLIDLRLDVAVLDAASISAAIFTGDTSTAASIMFLLKLSDMLEEYTRKRTKLALSEQLALNVEKVWLETDDKPILVPFSSITTGDRVIVYSGSIIPFDAVVCSGEAMVNQASMTGESDAVHKKCGDSVFAGTAVEDGSFTIEVKASSSESRLSKIISMIDESENLKAGVQSKAEHLADRIVPYSFLGFALSYAFTRNIQRALSVLMVDFSCAIKLSTPISVISAMREAAEIGAAVKGGKYLETLAEVDTIVFDKTGTLTNASPKVIDVVTFADFDRSYVLKTAACLEEHFPHSVATAVVEKAREENLIHDEEHAEVEYLVAHGIATQLHEQRAVIGSYHFIFEDEKVPISDSDKHIIDTYSIGKSSIFLAIGGILAGMIVIDDPIREDALASITALRQCGIKHICMLTGDSEPAAKRVAESLGLDMYVSQVLPEHKSEYIDSLKLSGHKVLMVGDGINDTPALACANVSAAMCKGSDVAREVADITLTEDGLNSIVNIRQLSTALMKRINNNFNFIVEFNAGLIALGVSGIIPPSTLALLHNASTMIISANSMTSLKVKTN